MSPSCRWRYTLRLIWGVRVGGRPTSGRDAAARRCDAEADSGARSFCAWAVRSSTDMRSSEMRFPSSIWMKAAPGCWCGPLMTACCSCL